MTTLTAPVTRSAASGAHRQGLAWNVWRQHRAALVGMGLMLVLTAIVIAVSGIRLHEDAAKNGPLRLTRSPYDTLALLTCAGLLKLVPLLAGAFLGAPLLAREFETGTSRFARTQGLSMPRQTAARLLLLGAVIAIFSSAIGLLVAWWSRPLTHAGLSSPWKAGGFDGSPVMLPAWALLAFSAGILAGVAIRRTVPAMVATLAVSAAGALLVGRLTTVLLSVGQAAARSVPLISTSGSFTGISRHGVLQWTGVPRRLRQVIKAPSYPSGAPGPHGTWQVSGWFTGPHGEHLSARAVAALMRQLPVRFAWSPQPARLHAWLAARHVTYWIGYQPASRYWLFQAAAAAILIALAVAAGFAAVRLTGRRA